MSVLSPPITNACVRRSFLINFLEKESDQTNSAPGIHVNITPPGDLLPLIVDDNNDWRVHSCLRTRESRRRVCYRCVSVGDAHGGGIVYACRVLKPRARRPCVSAPRIHTNLLCGVDVTRFFLKSCRRRLDVLWLLTTTTLLRVYNVQPIYLASTPARFSRRLDETTHVRVRSTEERILLR